MSRLGEIKGVLTKTYRLTVNLTLRGTPILTRPDDQEY